jgi:hypothetical protein
MERLCGSNTNPPRTTRQRHTPRPARLLTYSHHLIEAQQLRNLKPFELRLKQQIETLTESERLKLND